MSESESKSGNKDQWFYIDTHSQMIEAMEERIIALERGLEAVLRKMQASGQADDEPGWYGRPE